VEQKDRNLKVPTVLKALLLLWKDYKIIFLDAVQQPEEDEVLNTPPK
jgi:hypothetical protein